MSPASVVGTRIWTRGATFCSGRKYVGSIELTKRTPSTVAADRLARALGTGLTKLLADLERGSDASGYE